MTRDATPVLLIICLVLIVGGISWLALTTAPPERRMRYWRDDKTSLCFAGARTSYGGFVLVPCENIPTELLEP